MIASSTNKHPIVLDRQVLSRLGARLQHHRSIRFLVHFELTERGTKSSHIHLVVDRAVNPQISPRFQALDLHLIGSAPLNLKSGQIPFSSVMRHGVRVRVHADRLELVEVAVMTVLDHHGVVHLELVSLAEGPSASATMMLSMLRSMVSTMVSAMMLSVMLSVMTTMVLLSSSSSSSVPPHFEFTEITTTALMDALFRMEGQEFAIVSFQFDDAVLTVMHFEFAPIAAFALGIHFCFGMALHTKVGARVDVLEHETVSTEFLAVPLSRSALLAVESQLFLGAIMLDGDRVEPVEIAVATVLDHHDVVHLELVGGVELIGHG